MDHRIENLKTMTMAELVTEYNKYSETKIKRFSDKATGIKRTTEAILATIPKPKEKKVKGPMFMIEIFFNFKKARPATNKEASLDPKFRKICDEVGIEPTPRQASKLRNNRGIVFNYLRSVA